MDESHVLHMNCGAGETSYRNNSLPQRRVISLAKPLLEEAITTLYSGSLGTLTRLTIADLGCSSGPNTLFAVTELIETVDKLCEKMSRLPPEYQIFLNDLPGNDFNTIFRSLLPSSLKKGSSANSDDQITRDCFFACVAGSFYGRLFPKNALHFVHSNYCLHWLSQVPKGIEDNKGNIYMTSTSPKTVLDAYYEQFKGNFGMFLKCRGSELVPGGRMVLTFLGRQGDDRASGGCCMIWVLMATALSQMVSEGVIEEEKLHSFNIPCYTPTLEEVKTEVLDEGSFSIDHLESSEVSWNGRSDGDYELINGDQREEGYSFAKCMRAVAEPMLRRHFGDEDDIINDVLNRFKLFIVDHMDKNRTTLINVFVSLVRKS